ncbi:hypothetical protein [Shewanella insulae]|uniref:hypothetical protein n=1 Tax=Shewanella insulae TaxID=2681496 RepID=UPI00247FE234|nr:hypothetical protein [Shewanella insulae]
MMKLILLTALIYQPLYPNDGTRGAAMLASSSVQTSQQTMEGAVAITSANLEQLKVEIASELDKQLKALHADLAQQAPQQALLASQNQ